MSGNLHGLDAPEPTGSASNDCRRGSSAGETLTALEKKILQLIAFGKTSQEISKLLGLSVRSVYDHQMDIMDKLNLKNPSDLVKYVIKEGYTYKEI